MGGHAGHPRTAGFWLPAAEPGSPPRATPFAEGLPVVIPLLLLLHAAGTLYMTGLIWFVQLVHYPLFSSVGKESFVAYEARHTFWTSFAVGPPMLLELATGLALLVVRPSFLPTAALVAGLVLLGVVWGTTFLLSVPQHEVLSRGFDGRAHAILVGTNWLRTVGWSLRAVLVLWFLSRAMQASAA